MDISETIEASDLKVGRCRQLHVIELMKVWKVKVISWPWPQVIYIWKLNFVFLRNHLAIFNQKFCMKVFRYKEMKIYEHDAGHMTKMAATPIYGKNLSKILSWISGQISMNLGM